MSWIWKFKLDKLIEVGSFNFEQLGETVGFIVVVGWVIIFMAGTRRHNYPPLTGNPQVKGKLMSQLLSHRATK